MNRFIATLLLSLAAVWPLVASTQTARLLDIGWIEGRWEKAFLTDNGARNQDPRWELALHFGPGDRFSYLSKSTTEIRLTDGSARPMVSETAISGRWTMNGRGQVILAFDRAPAGHKKTTVSADFDGALLRVSGLERERLLYFRKAAK
ncbi:MAG TPA: hypothetical protein VJ797_11450 [Burkholderiales bacterium]|nr:hypothetical protein [Burkholderiales bacterium]